MGLFLDAELRQPMAAAWLLGGDGGGGVLPARLLGLMCGVCCRRGFRERRWRYAAWRVLLDGGALKMHE